MNQTKSKALYGRVSTDEQVREGVSLKEQEERLRAYCRAMGWNEEPSVYIDDGYSAKDLDRPKLNELIDDIKHGKISMVLVTKLDRMSRRLMHLLEMIELLHDYEVTFISISEAFDTNTPSGRLTLQVLGAVAEFERERIRERVFDNMQHSAKHGKWLTQSPYGYDLVDKALMINKKEAIIVQRIFDMYLNQGLGMYRIAKQLNEEGIPTKHHKEWSVRTVKLTLKNPAYKGALVWNRSDRNNKKQKIKDEDQWITVEDAHPAIIEKETWEAVQHKLPKPNMHPRAKTSPHLLGGILKCGRCGSGMSIMWSGSPNKRKRIYRCSANKNKGTCTSKSYPAKDVEQWFKQGLKQLSESIDESYLYLLKDKMNSDVKLENARQIQVVKNRYQRKVEAYTSGLIELEDLQKEKDRMETIINEADNQESSSPHVDVAMLEEKLNQKITSILDAIDYIPVVDAKALVSTLVEKVILYEEKNIDIVLGVPS